MSPGDLLQVERVNSPAVPRAQTRAIQVYTAQIASPNEVTLTLHDNSTPDGPREPAFRDGIVPGRAPNVELHP